MNQSGVIAHTHRDFKYCEIWFSSFISVWKNISMCTNGWALFISCNWRSPVRAFVSHSCAYIVQWLSGFMLQLFIPKCQQVMKHICGWKLLFQLYGKSFILLLKLNFFGSSSKMAWHCTPLHSEWMIHLSWDIFKSLSNVKHIFRSWNVQFNLLVL